MIHSAANVELTGSDVSGEPLRAAYAPPELLRLGDLRSVTLGGSPGSGDSGAPTAQNIPGPPI